MINKSKLFDCWNRDLVDALFPEHSRTSCSDKSIVNGIGSGLYNGRTAPRCDRCAALEILRDKTQGADADLAFDGITLSANIHNYNWDEK